ncbi:hypothetical protein AB6813_13045 [bacterium RCC_150]
MLASIRYREVNACWELGGCRTVRRQRSTTVLRRQRSTTVLRRQRSTTAVLLSAVERRAP